MAGYMEMQSFIGKFHYLLKCGMEADLHMRCFSGQVYVNLQAGLGYIHPPPMDGQYNHVSSPRVRRRHRRKKAKKQIEKMKNPVQEAFAKKEPETKFPIQETYANNTESYTDGTTECVEEATENSDKNHEEADISDDTIEDDELETARNAIENVDDIARKAPIMFMDMDGMNSGEINRVRNILEGTDGVEGNYCSRSEDS